jgi:hypothetical protein
MAVAFDRKLGESTSLTSIPAGDIDGEFVVIWVACDNTAGTNLPTVSAVLHNAVSQTYSVVASHGSASTTAAAATRGFIIAIPSATGTTGTLEVQLSATPSKAVALAAVFTGVETTPTPNTPGSTTSINTVVTSSGGGSNGLSLGLLSYEDNAAWAGTGFTNGGGFTAPGGDGAVFTTGGGAASNIVMEAGYLVNTGGDATGFTPTGMSNDGGACVVSLAVADAGTNLVIAAADHAHSADSLALTQVHTVVTAEARSTHTADQVALSQNSNLVIADSTHAHAADGNIVLTIVTQLLVADSSHAHSADGVVLTQQHSLAVAEALHGHTADQVALVQNTTASLVINDALHSVTSDLVTLTQRVIIYYASTPVREPYQWEETGLLKFYKQIEGVTWWKIGSEWFSGNYQEDQIAGASVIYRGGYEHRVDGSAVAELEALGFTIRQEFIDE